MTRFDRALFHLANALVGVTGLVYAVMRYLLEPSEPFAVVNHPAQPLVQHLHVWTAPLLVFAFGHFFLHHAWAGWRGGVREGRRTGLLMLALGAPMIGSGYFLQTATHETWRRICIALHVVTGLFWLLGAAGHWIVHLRAARGRAG
jgi:hypothetical protein